MIYNKDIPIDAHVVLNTLRDNGYEAYLVGGCVRDLLLMKEPKDFDVCTNALPEEVMNIFEPTHNVIPTGLKHGTVTLIADNLHVKDAVKLPIEVTTFRVDGDYSDNRRPDSVSFSRNVKDDISRRDFTINGLLFSNKGEEISDYFGGYDDLLNGIVRAIGNPEDRFKEDPLRMMRSIRFSCQLEFEIECNTFKAIRECADMIVKISWERIRDELCKILLSEKPSYGIDLLGDSGILYYILPELFECIGFDQRNPHHHKDIYEHILKVVDSTPNALNIRLAALLHDIAKPKTFSVGEDGVGHFYQHHVVGADMTEEILKRFKFDNDTINNVKILVGEHMSRYPNLRGGSIKKLINRLGEHNIDDFINLQLADIIGSKPPYNFDSVIDLKREIKRVLDTKEPLSVKDLVVNGYDLIEMGIKPGKRMGEILNELLEMVLKNPELNTKEYLLIWVKSIS